MASAGRFYPRESLAAGFLLELRVELSNALVEANDVLGHHTLVAFATSAFSLQVIKPIEKPFSLPSPFAHIHKLSNPSR
jgi:hypothetical protein